MKPIRTRRMIIPKEPVTRFHDTIVKKVVSMKMIMTQWKAIISQRSLLLAVTGILFVPLLYGGFFLSAFWDPYGRTNQLKVAVINHDKPAIAEGKTLALGDSLVKNLKANHSFHWVFPEDLQTARYQLNHNDYYMVIDIPGDFSKNAATLMNINPKPVFLNYYTNSGKSYTASQMVKQLVPNINHKIAKAVTKSYTLSLFSTIQSINGGLKKIDTASSRLGDGSEKLYQQMNRLTSSSLLFRNGLQAASDGDRKLSVGLAELNAGFKTFNHRFAELKTGQDQLHNGITEAAGGSRSLDQAMHQLNASEQAFNNQLSEVIDQFKPRGSGPSSAESSTDGSIGDLTSLLNGLQSELGQFVDVQQSMIDSTRSTLTNIHGIQKSENRRIQEFVGTNRDLDPVQKKTLADGLTEIQSQASEGLTSEIEPMTAKLNQAQSQLDNLRQTQNYLDQWLPALSGINTKNSGQDPADILALTKKIRKVLTDFQNSSNLIARGTSSVAEQTEKMAEAMNKISGGSKKLQGGTEELQAGSRKLARGASELSTGNKKLSDGLHTLADYSRILNSGSNQLADGTSRLSDNANTLHDGIHAFSQKLGQQPVLNQGGQRANLLATPMNANINDSHVVQNYGVGLAPYILSLGLFVGALTFTMFFPMRRPSIAPTSGLDWFLSKFSVASAAAVLQALFICTLLLKGLGLEVTSVWRFYLFSIIVSLSFFALVQWLVTAFGNGGRMISGLLLLIQFGGSSGVFPVALTPVFFQWVHAILPMTYSVNGFRQIISIGKDDYYLLEQTVIMVMIMILSMGLSWLTFSVLKKRSAAGNMPALPEVVSSESN
ncbi:YhgE/Pip domain-containing protein [Sporolactobacillus sp. THM7-4]|nr:YhgE/Pip domain-containing protein [Sporolactobacillus sp. THM7-4]